MSKLLASTLLALISTAVFACPPEDELIKSATQIIYADADIRNYVCAENTSCNFDEFFPKVTVTKVDLIPPGNPMQEGVLVEPSNRGLQYFSAIFLRRECAYHLAFSPDVTLSGVKILDRNHNGMRLIRAIERDSTVRWNEIDYAFDEHTKTYVEIRKRCYGAKGKAAVRVKCR